MIVTEQWIREAGYQYTKYLGTHSFEVKADKPPDQRVGETRARASSLRFCPLATAFQSSGTTPTHPHLTKENNRDLMQILTDGVLWGAFWRNAIDMAAAAEKLQVYHEVECETLLYVGRIDTLIPEVADDTRCVIEYKRSDKWSDGSDYYLQVAAYMFAKEAERSFIVIQHRPGIVIVPGIHIKEGCLFGDTLVTRADIYAKIAELNATKVLVRDGRMTTPSIIPGECCVERTKLAPSYPKSGPNKGLEVPGTFTAACPYAGYCFPIAMGGVDNRTDVLYTRYGQSGDLELYRGEGS